MNRKVRVLILTNGARNPFLEAWVACIRSSGARVAVLLDTRRMRDDYVPDVLFADTVVVPADGGTDWIRAVHERLEGDPDILFDYWGMATLLNTIGTRTWPKARRVVCVDTFPNASRRRAEVRDVVQSNALLHRADGLTVASRAMARSVRRATLGRSSGLPASVVYSPFPASAHADGSHGRSYADGTLSLCFTGRSDFLFSQDPRMAKDAVGPYLQGFIERGAEMSVLDPGDERIAAELRNRGFRFYSSVSRSGMTSGDFARTISPFHGHIVTYAQAGPVVRRRVENSLSTRFATAVCAPTPIVAPRASGFVDEFFDRNPIGFRADDPDEILQRLRSDGPTMADAWRTGHDRWTGEAYGPALAEQWERVLNR